MRFTFVVILFGAACVPTRGQAAFPVEEVREPMVEEHNAVRASGASPAPDPPLEALRWSDGLAEIAQEHADRCVFEHSTNPFGENLAFFSCPGGFEGPCDEDELGSTPADAVRGWAEEVEFYDYASNSCEAGQQCGHYTQIVWRDTREVGCGSSICNVDGINGVIWVCNYDPPGNVIGERPY